MIHKEIADKYRILHLLQHGIAGDVFLVEHKALSCRRVLKIIEKTHPQYEFLVKEARILQRFHHSSIPIIYDISDFDTKTYLFEEFIEGENLKQYVQRQQHFSEALLLNYSTQLCEILQYIHSPAHRVLHLDIKPENILISDGQLKLIDFGSAICQNEARQDQVYFGSHGFFAPEQKQAGTLSEETDIYGTGKLMQYMLFHASKIPKGYVEIVKNCLRTGKKRYCSSDEIMADLQQLNLKKTKKQPIEQWFAVTGIPTNYHSSMFALQLADYLQKHSRKRVLLLDCNPGGMMEQLEDYETNSKETQRSFVYERNRITIAKRVTPQEAKGWRGRGYAYVVCDFGNLSTYLTELQYTCCFHTGSMTAWTIDHWCQSLEHMKQAKKNILVITEGDSSVAYQEFGNKYEVLSVAIISAMGRCNREFSRLLKRLI